MFLECPQRFHVCHPVRQPKSKKQRTHRAPSLLSRLAPRSITSSSMHGNHSKTKPTFFCVNGAKML